MFPVVQLSETKTVGVSLSWMAGRPAGGRSKSAIEIKQN